MEDLSQNIKGRRGRERVWRRRKRVVRLLPRWSPIQSTTSWRGLVAHHCNLLNLVRRCPCEEALASVWRDSRAAEEQRKQGREEQKLLDNLIQK